MVVRPFYCGVEGFVVSGVGVVAGPFFLALIQIYRHDKAPLEGATASCGFERFLRGFAAVAHFICAKAMKKGCFIVSTLL